MKHLHSLTKAIFDNPDVQRTFNIVGFVVAIVGILFISLNAQTGQTRPVAIDAPYPDMPTIAPIGVRVGKYMDIPESAKGPAIDPAKGYRIQDLGKGLYMVTDNAYQSLFMVYETGVVVVDAPQSYAQYIPKAISEITKKPITHLVYSHYHADHIGGASSLPDSQRSLRRKRRCGF